MSELEGNFAKLLGRKPTDAELRRLYRAKDAIGIRDNDALWTILFAFEQYHHLYDQMPAAITRATEDILKKFRSTAEATAKAASASAQADLAAAVAAASQKVARAAAQKQMWQWAAGCILTAVLMIAGVAWFAKDAGYRAGYAQGHIDMQDDKERATWGNTPQGKQAYRLAEAGSLDLVINCNQPGWVKKSGYCYPQPDHSSKQVYGWRLP